MRVWKFPSFRVAFLKLGALMFYVDLGAEEYGHGRFAAIHLYGRQLVSIPLSRR